RACAAIRRAGGLRRRSPAWCAPCRRSRRFPVRARALPTMLALPFCSMCRSCAAPLQFPGVLEAVAPGFFQANAYQARSWKWLQAIEDFDAEILRRGHALAACGDILV